MTGSPGRAHLPQDFLDGFKREKTARALSALAHETGLCSITVALITKEAKIARNTFYELFPNRDAAARYAVDLGNERLLRAIDGAAAKGGPPRQRIRTVVNALIDAAEAEPYLTEMCLFHGRGVEGPAIPDDPAPVGTLAGILRSARTSAHPQEPGPHTEELIAYGIFATIGERLCRGGIEGLQDLGEELTEIATLSFGGAEDHSSV